MGQVDQFSVENPFTAIASGETDILSHHNIAVKLLETTCFPEKKGKKENQASGTCAIDFEMWASWQFVVALFLKCNAVRNQYAESSFGKLAWEPLEDSESCSCIHSTSRQVPYPNLALCKIKQSGHYLPVTVKIRQLGPLWEGQELFNSLF